MYLSTVQPQRPVAECQEAQLLSDVRSGTFPQVPCCTDSYTATFPRVGPGISLSSGRSSFGPQIWLFPKA